MAVKGMSKSATPEIILNTIRANASSDYQERVPVATQQNIAEVGNAITNYEPTRNEFLNALINRIGMVIIQSRLYENPLREFKKGMLEFGKDIEEIFVEIAKAQSYNPEVAETEVFKRVIPDVKTIFHRMNRQDFYKVTISNDQLRTAFLSYRGIEDLIGRIVDSLYSGDNYDEFLLMKHLMLDYGDKGLFYPITVTAVTDEATAKKLTVKLRATAKTIGFMSPNYNAQGVHTFTPMEDIIIFMTPETEALMDVESLARAFNLEYADFLGRVVIVDDFGGLENVQALMVDRQWFMVYDTFFNFTEQYNAQGLYWNYFFHHWQVLSTSQFANAIAFTTETPAITSVTISPKTATVSKGQNVQFTTTVVATGMASEAISYNVTGAVSDNTTITSNGLLIVGSDETATELTVSAISIFDSSKNDSATITVTA
ncbi:hypothetical protein MKA36_21070 [[Clostridium] innocuum]|jgi:hypothetical protein|nr:hypothetical protein [[Clostridium] innocuum]